MENCYTSACCSNKGPLSEKMHIPVAIITEITVFDKMLSTRYLIFMSLYTLNFTYLYLGMIQVNFPIHINLDKTRVLTTQCVSDL